MVFLLNGWNEVSASTVEAAMLQLRDLERNFPSAGIVVATRTHHLTPPLPGAFRATLRPLSREQRNQYLQLALGASAHGLRVKLDNNRMLDQITRTPLILAEVADLNRSGKEIPSTKMGVLNAVMQVMEQSGEHRVHLQQAPLGGYAGEYLRALSMEMTTRNEVEMSEADARAIVHSVSTMLRAANQIANVPEPLDVLNELSKHHILERIEHPDAFFRFQHQQFQEYFAANGLKTRLGDVVRGKSQEEEENFLKHFVNEPKWGESLRMMAEEIGTASASKEMVDGGAKLVCMALKVDPIFAGELGRWCGPTVWEEVGNEVGERLRAYYAQPDRHEKECALAAMLSTGRHDFADVLVPLLSTSDRQIRLALYYGGVEFLPSCIGPNWMEVVRGWPEEARLDLVVELAHDPWLAETVQQFALSDPSEKVKWNVARMLSWYGFREKVEHLLATLGDAAFREARRTMRAEEIPNSLWPRVVGLYEKMYTETAVPSERLGLLRMMKEFGAADVTERMKAVLEGLEEEQLKNGNDGGTKWALGEMRKTDPEWVSIWLGRIAPAGSTRFGGWNEMVSGLPTGEQERLLDEFSGAVPNRMRSKASCGFSLQQRMRDWRCSRSRRLVGFAEDCRVRPDRI
jgi:hypothetical protein